MNTSTMDFDRERPVTVEYNRNGQRVQRTFKDHYAARRFYAAKLLAQRNPKVVATPQPSPTAR